MKLLDPYKPEHPLFPLNRGRLAGLLQKYGLERANGIIDGRNKRIQAAEADPLNHGWEPPTWAVADLLIGLITPEQYAANEDVPAAWRKKDVIERMLQFATRDIRLILILGGNRSSKTEYLCKRIVQCALRNPGANIWLFHEDMSQSVEWHQPVIWKYLPPSWKMMGKGQIGYVSYSVKNGFTDAKLVGPDGQVISFKTYEEKERSIEGAELGAPSKAPCIGFGMDEKAPYTLFETMRFRLATRHAVGVLGFTPTEGYSDVCADFLDGASTVIEEMVEGMTDGFGAPERSALVERSAKAGRRVVYFFTQFNIFGEPESVRQIAAGDPRHVQLMRLTGKPYKAKMSRFPRFSEPVHAVPPEMIPAEGTNYLICDPAGRRNWFMLWGRMDPYDRLWIYREWPCRKIRIPGVGNPEPWAIPGADRGHAFGGLPGGGQKGFGFGFPEYKNEIARLERWHDRLDGAKRIEEWMEHNDADEKIRMRFLDPRYAGMPTAQDPTETVLDACGKVGLFFEAADGGRIDPGVDLINDRFAHKEGWKESGKIEDGPRLLISADCENLIFALKTWTGDGGDKEATKDPIDVLRYFMTTPAICYVSEELLPARKAGGYGGATVGEPGKFDTSKRSKLLAPARTERRGF